ncbi:hypothetical protein K443DRAFT_133686 [Laccaria amethystina LaAM-08-1]|uniref:Peptidyl-prolyl cis-trans isomerase n=1 Tax=Laccaria amethystina LaAM-08-1 TaxID=1095629 RepID=A0A0C9WYI7_9AGAR|nr:hypothetical protein K443DRAFT_133686 [Laccaria amethystina LaAM-08-1]
MSQWEIRMSNSKKVPYFFHNETKQSVWDAPASLSEEEIKGLPGYEYLINNGNPHAGQVRASHLLIKHKDSRRPSSWKEQNITRTKEEAIAILREHQAAINGSTDKFTELASEHSDCSSHTHGGDLGWFGRGQMQKPFEDAAYGLKVGEISDVISSDSGVHLVLRTA